MSDENTEQKVIEEPQPEQNIEQKVIEEQKVMEEPKVIEEPKVKVKLAKNPKRVEQGKRLAAISREAKERKRAAMLVESESETSSSFKWFVLGGSLLLSVWYFTRPTKYILRPVVAEAIVTDENTALATGAKQGTTAAKAPQDSAAAKPKKIRFATLD